MIAKQKKVKKAVTAKKPQKKTATKKVLVDPPVKPLAKAKASVIKKKAKTASKNKKKVGKSPVMATAILRSSNDSSQNGPYQARDLVKKKDIKRKNYLAKKDTAFFISYFTEKRGRLLSELDSTKNSLLNDSNNFPDQADRATLEEEFSIELRTRDRERRLLNKIEHSMHLLENGGFGYCEECGDKIGRDRLYFRPEATLCIECKSGSEREEKQVTKSR